MACCGVCFGRWLGTAGGLSPFMGTNIQLRRMRLGEAAAASRLMRKVIKSLPISPRECYGELAKYTAACLRRMIKRDAHAVVVAVEDERIVGFCVSRPDDGLLLLEWYGVHPERRGLGIGRLLLEHLLGTAGRRGCHKLWCDSNTNNRASHRLLSSLGFEPFATVKNHWYGEDFILWERQVLAGRGRTRRLSRAPRRAPRVAAVPAGRRRRMVAVAA